MGTTVLPSVKERTETSGPVRNSSMTTWLPAVAEDLVLHAWPGRLPPPPARVMATVTPLPRARPSALTTVGMRGGFAGSPGRRPGRQRPRRRRWGCGTFSSGPWRRPCCPPGWPRPCRGRSRGCPRLPVASTSPQHQGIVRGHHGKVDGVVLGKGRDGRPRPWRRCRHADGVGGDAAVAGRGSRCALTSGLFFRLLDDGVLPAAAAYHENCSWRIFLLTISDGTGACR